MSRASLLEFAAVAVTLPDEGLLLDGLSFNLAPGESVVLTGAAGCGKSAALALTVGLLKPTWGTVTVLGANPATLTAAALDGLRATIGFSPQRGALLSNLSLADNVALPLRWHRGLSATAADAAVRETYALMGAPPPPTVQASLAAEEHRQLARLARAIVLRPALLVIDEPGGGLDALQREDLWRLLWRLQEDLGCAILAATSDAGPAAALTSRTIPLPPRRHTTLGILRPDPIA